MRRTVNWISIPEIILRMNGEHGGRHNYSHIKTCVDKLLAERMISKNGRCYGTDRFARSRWIRLTDRLRADGLLYVGRNIQRAAIRRPEAV